MAEKKDGSLANPFDKASRFMAKLDPSALIGWLLGLAAHLFVFQRWLDARRMPTPGNPDRVNDTVAYLENTGQHHLPWALRMEFNAAPDSLMPGRLMEYSGMLWRDEKPSPERGDRFQIGSVVVNLTGVGRSGHFAEWPEAGLRTILQPVEVNLSEKDAGEILKEIMEQRSPRIILPWVPLMRGGERESVIETWKAVASLEPDRRRRPEYAALARIFSDAAERGVIWKEALKEWDMIESSTVNEWKAMGQKTGARDAVLKVLETRFGSVPPDLVSVINSIQELPQLNTLLVDATRSESLPAFSLLLNQTPS